MITKNGGENEKKLEILIPRRTGWRGSSHLAISSGMSRGHPGYPSSWYEIYVVTSLRSMKSTGELNESKNALLKLQLHIDA